MILLQVHDCPVFCCADSRAMSSDLKIITFLSYLVSPLPTGYFFNLRIPRGTVVNLSSLHHGLSLDGLPKFQTSTVGAPQALWILCIHIYPAWSLRALALEPECLDFKLFPPRNQLCRSGRPI